MSLLRIEGLSRTFGGVQAVRDLSFALGAARIHAIIGPNGAGKTTLFNLISGVLPADAGRIWLAGEDVTGRATLRARPLGPGPHLPEPALFPNMTVGENVMLGRHRHLERGFLRCLLRSPRIVRSERDCRERAAAMLRRVGLPGEPRRARRQPCLWRAAAGSRSPARSPASRKLLLLDEPAAGCNARETAEIDALIQSIADEGITVLLVEHDMRLVMGISERILVLDHGERLAEGTPAEIRADPAVIAAYLGTGR